jgi:hypothetical protein
MNPLILLAGNPFPAILDLAVGKRAGAVSKAVVDAVTSVTGVSDPAKVEAKLAADQKLTSQLRLELAQIALDEKKIMLEAELAARKAALDAEAAERKALAEKEAAERKDRLDAEIAAHKAALEAALAAQKASIAEREQDLRDTSGARQMLSEMIEKRATIAYAPFFLSALVTIGFFVVLAMFIFMKPTLERAEPPKIPSEVVGILKTLEPMQIAALVQPRSDFVVQIINICVGTLAAAFATVMSFWLGSSQSSRNKDVMVANLQERTAEAQQRQAQQNIDMVRTVTETVAQGAPAILDETGTPAPTTKGMGRVITTVPSGSAIITGREAGGNHEVGGNTVPAPTPAADPAPEPVKPAPAGLVAEILPELTKPHRHFDDSVIWALTPAGIAIDGAPATGTPGEPSTVRRIWESFGPLCAAAARQYGVPVELIIATIATESSGNANARRAEPQLNDESVGLMQTLVATARFATGRKSLRGDDLLDPMTSIGAGAAYIAMQRGSTHFDPPLVAAAYNAGSLKRDPADANRWKLHCFPRGTGHHIDKFVAWFNDAMRVSAQDGWSTASGCPSFAAAFGASSGSSGSGGGVPGSGGGPSPKPAPQGRIARPAIILDVNAPGFPPKPDFIRAITRAERAERFGDFQFTPDPTTHDGDGIRILNGWDAANIETFVIPIGPHPALRSPFRVTMHRLARQQMVDLWLAWEKAGLLHHVVSWDGAFVPRFQRSRKKPPPPNRPLSNHAFGTAFDINAAQNGLGVEPALIGRKGCVRELVPLANQHGFHWGGHFNSRKDGMHFEIGKFL